MTWQVGFVVGFTPLMEYSGGWREGLLALVGGLLALWALRLVDMIGDRVGECIRGIVEQRERHDRLVRELLALLEERRPARGPRRRLR